MLYFVIPPLLLYGVSLDPIEIYPDLPQRTRTSAWVPVKLQSNLDPTAPQPTATVAEMHEWPPSLSVLYTTFNASFSELPPGSSSNTSACSYGLDIANHPQRNRSSLSGITGAAGLGKERLLFDPACLMFHFVTRGSGIYGPGLFTIGLPDNISHRPPALDVEEVFGTRSKSWHAPRSVGWTVPPGAGVLAGMVARGDTALVTRP
ncbi:hypothetical protein NMY22_g17847 [Coprinellus aureogranulatus]|nr:hypothetical protein NMY22_g17847 [Coprinellus aureogranulatus]